MSTSAEIEGLSTADEPGALVAELLGEAGRADPYPLYRRLHALGSASQVTEGFFVVNGYAEVNAVLRNPAFGRREGLVEPGSELAEHSSLTSLSEGILDLNPPRHTRAKRLLSAVFTPRRVGGLAPAIASTTRVLLDAMAEAGAGGRAVDFMDAFAFRLPVSVICELLGVPEQDRHRFRPLARDLTIALEVVDDLSVLGPADAATDELAEYFTALVAERRAHPREDLISALIHETDGG